MLQSIHNHSLSFLTDHYFKLQNIFENSNSTMQQIRYITSHPKLSIFILYTISFIVLGNAMLALGTMFPYLSAHSHRKQTQYSYLFLCRAAGFISGPFLVKWLEKIISLHHGICLGAGLSGIFSIFFCYTTNFELMGLWVFLGCIGQSFISVFVNVSAIESFSKDNLPIWLQSLHGCFGIGGLMGPFTVYLFELNSYLVIGLSFLILIPLILRVPSPEIVNHTQQGKQQLISKDENDEQKQIPILLSKHNYLISLIFFFILGQECTFGGWVSSYAVLEGFSQKQHATMYGSLFWISMTFFRFAFAFVPGKPSTKVYVLIFISFLQTFIGIFIVYHISSQIGLIMSAIVFGMASSVLFPLLLIIPQQFGFKVTASQNSNFIISAAMGEGTLAVLVGYLMGTFTYKWFFYCMGFFNIFAFFAHHISTSSLQKMHRQQLNEKEHQLKDYHKKEQQQ